MYKLFLALENEGAIPDDQSSPEGAIPPEAEAQAASTVEEAHTGVFDLVSLFDEHQKAVSDGIESADTLTALSGQMQKSVDEGQGMPADSIEMVEVAVESICTKLGLSKNTLRKIPSLEHFKSSRSRVEATKIAIESIGGTIKTIWEQVVKILKNMLAQFKIFLGNYIHNFKLLEDRLNALLNKAKAATGEPVKPELAKPTIAAFFTVDGKAGLKTVNEYLATISGFDLFAENVLNPISKASDDMKRASNTGSSEFEQHVNVVYETLHKSRFINHVLPGNKMFVIEREHDSFSLHLVSARRTLGKESNDPEYIEALTKDQIVALGEKAIHLSRGGKEVKDLLEASSKVMNIMIGSSEEIIKVASKLDHDTALGAARGSATVMTSFTKVVSQLGLKLPAMYFNTLKHVSDYMAASIQNLATAAAPEATPPPAAA